MADLDKRVSDLPEMTATLVMDKLGNAKLVAETPAGRKSEGSSVIFETAGTLSTVVGAGPVLISPPGDTAMTLPLPAGTVVTAHAAVASVGVSAHGGGIPLPTGLSEPQKDADQ